MKSCRFPERLFSILKQHIMETEPILFYYESINRNAIVVKPKKPFFDWVNSIEKNTIAVDKKYEYNIYLVKEQDSNEDTLSWLKKNFHVIFNNELNDWTINQSKWPDKRTYPVFKEWFDVEISSMILDMEDFDIIKE